MSVRHALTAAPIASTGALTLTTPAAAHVLAQPAIDALTVTPGRLWSLVAALVAVAGVVVAGVALARPNGRLGTGPRPTGALVALAAGVAGMVTGGLVVITAEGGPGTGYGIVGGFLDLAVGLLAVVLGALALARAKRTA
ncbi:DUF6223 family protein [Saccharomonospora cyanea]|nr:DUF6223 family protein [Saccharomonospora cyanea]